MRKNIAKIFQISLAVPIIFGAVPAAKAEETVRFSYAKCAHCTPVALTPQFGEGYNIDAIQFNTGSDSLTALLTGNSDIAQVTYIGFVTALDKNLDVVAVSGHVNGGSQILVGNDLNVNADDWDGLLKLIDEYKVAGKPFRVAASRGSAQDLHLRGALAKHGIDVNKDTQFVNIPNPSDHNQALLRGEVELISTVEPFASQIRKMQTAKFFTLPYDQASGSLTGLIVTRPDTIRDNPKAVQAAVNAWLKVENLIKGDPSAWAGIITKQTGLDNEVALNAIKNLQPDHTMHVSTTVAIAKLMKELNYISRDVASEIPERFDFTFLEAATGKARAQLGD